MARTEHTGRKRTGEKKDIRKRRPIAGPPEDSTPVQGFRASDWTVPVFASVETEAQLSELLMHRAVRRIYLDEAGFSDLPVSIARIHAAGKEAGLRLRRIQREFDAAGRPEKSTGTVLSELLSCSDAALRPDAVLLRSFDEAMECRTLFPESGDFTRCFDYTMYGYNGEAVQALRMLGADALTCPIELTASECSRLPKTLPYELLVYGHLPMMVSANCLQKTSAHCDHQNRIRMLRDRMGKSMPVRCYCRFCYNQIFNADPLVLYDLPEEVLRLQPQYIRYDFSVETADTVRRVLNGRVPEKLTRGHFRHGIE